MPSSLIQTPAWLRQMESILEELNEGVIIVDEQLRMIFANEALIRLGRYEPGDIQGHTPDAIFPKEDLPYIMRQHELSQRPYTGLPDLDYPLHDKTIVVTRCGGICLGKKKINFSQVFAGHAVGIKEVHDDIWLVSFMDYDLGYFDLETRVLEPLENPFGPKVLPMS